MSVIVAACSFVNAQKYGDDAYSVGSQVRNTSFPRIRKDWLAVAPDAAAAIERALHEDLDLQSVTLQEASDLEIDADPSFEWFGDGKSSVRVGNAETPVFSVFVGFGPYFGSGEMIGIAQVVDDNGPLYRFDFPRAEFEELLSILFPQVRSTR